jgi:hypothetical protein
MFSTVSATAINRSVSEGSPMAIHFLSVSGASVGRLSLNRLPGLHGRRKLFLGFFLSRGKLKQERFHRERGSVCVSLIRWLILYQGLLISRQQGA